MTVSVYPAERVNILTSPEIAASALTDRFPLIISDPNISEFPLIENSSCTIKLPSTVAVDPSSKIIESPRVF